MVPWIATVSQLKNPGPSCDHLNSSHDGARTVDTWDSASKSKQRSKWIACTAGALTCAESWVQLSTVAILIASELCNRDRVLANDSRSGCEVEIVCLAKSSTTGG